MRRARLAPAMISTPGHRASRRRQRGALPAWSLFGLPPNILAVSEDPGRRVGALCRQYDGRKSDSAGPGTRRSAGRYSRPYRRPLSRTLRRQIAVSAATSQAGFARSNPHRLISEAIRGGRDDVVVHSKSGSPRYGPEAVRRGGDPGYPCQTDGGGHHRIAQRQCHASSKRTISK